MRDEESPSRDFADAFDDAVIGLRATVELACLQSSSWPAKVTAAIYAVLEFVSAEPQAARVLTADALAFGPYGAERRWHLIDHFATLLATGRDHRIVEGELPHLTEQALVGGIAWVITREVDAGHSDRLDSLLPELVELALLPYLGRVRAKRWGRCSHCAVVEVRARRA